MVDQFAFQIASSVAVFCIHGETVVKLTARSHCDWPCSWNGCRVFRNENGASYSRLIWAALGIAVVLALVEYLRGHFH
jgi:hypothetical protein